MIFLSILNKKYHHNLFEEAPYSCEVCKKPFAIKSILKIHLKKHSDVKAFKCNVCDKGFKYKRTLDDHKKICSNIQELSFNSEEYFSTDEDGVTPGIDFALTYDY